MRHRLIAFVVFSVASATASTAMAFDLPADLQQRADAWAEQVGADTEWREILRSEIEPDPTCDPSTPLTQWMDSLVEQVSPATLEVLSSFAVYDWAFFWSFGGDPDTSDEVFGVNGEYTTELLRRFREHLRFWTVPLDAVLLQAATGQVLAEDTMMVPLVAIVFEVDTSTAQTIVDFVQATIESDPGIDYDHPIFTFNAWAFVEQVIPGVGPLPDTVVMGDGILEGFEAIGLGDVAPDVILAHEMSHQVQYELGVFSDGTPEGTRRTELMADAFAGYEVAHVRGVTFQTKRIIDSIAIWSNTGDCEFDNPNHHGTPDQRAAAAEWGVDLAASMKPRADVIPSDQLVGMFDDVLPTLVGND